MIYLDNAATTPLDINASKELVKYSCDTFFNPSAIYSNALENSKNIEQAKKTICKVLGVNFNDNLIFTGSATEANNLAIMGSLRKNFGKLLFSYAEHPSVFNVALKLKNLGYDIEFIKLNKDGSVDISDLESKLDSNVSFISIMMCSNETGAINDLRKIYELKTKYCPNAIFHSDGVQGFCKNKINLDYFGVDLFTISGHKAFGPKGIGALYVKDKKILNPIIYGGGQEYNLRSGTENVAGIMAFKSAVENMGSLKDNLANVKKCYDAFVCDLESDEIRVIKTQNPYIVSISLLGVNGETIVHMLAQEGILISRGSACSSKKAGNRVLENIGLSPQEILGSVRISFSKDTKVEDVIKAKNFLLECYYKLKEKLK